MFKSIFPTYARYWEYSRYIGKSLQFNTYNGLRGIMNRIIFIPCVILIPNIDICYVGKI